MIIEIYWRNNLLYPTTKGLGPSGFKLLKPTHGGNTTLTWLNEILQLFAVQIHVII